jgi:hypothetical protein
LGPTCFILFTWSPDTHVGLQDLDLGGFICRFACSPTSGDGDDTTINIRWEVGGGRVTKGGVEGDGDGEEDGYGDGKKGGG